MASITRSPSIRAPATDRRRRPMDVGPSCRCSWHDSRCRHNARVISATRHRSAHPCRASDRAAGITPDPAPPRAGAAAGRSSSRNPARGPAGTTAPARTSAAAHAPPGRAGTARRASAPAAAHRCPSRPSRATKAIGVLQVGPDAHLGHRDLRLGQFRIAEIPPLEQPGEHVADLLRHAQLPLRRAGRRLPQPGTISVSKHSITSPSCRSWKLANDRPHS